MLSVYAPLQRTHKMLQIQKIVFHNCAPADLKELRQLGVDGIVCVTNTGDEFAA
jgi:hypothetical protein